MGKRNSDRHDFGIRLEKNGDEISAIQKIFINLQILSMFRSFFMTETIMKTSAWTARLYTCYEDSKILSPL